MRSRLRCPTIFRPALREKLEASGVDALYSHQARDLGCGTARTERRVTTGTASGKSLAFNLPVLAALTEQPKLRALYLYPTKALAQDQVSALGGLSVKRIRAAIYDGDTESERRWQIRKWSNLILTNPDMLHVGVLPHHDRWGDVLSNLRYVVVDEAHVYRGVFGSHVGNVLRRLRRLARVYGAEPQFLLASATIANPGELALALTGSTSPSSARTERRRPSGRSRSGTRRSSTRSWASARARSREASKLMADLVERGLRTLVFAKSRRSAELIHKFTADRLGDASRLSPYRAGTRLRSGARSSSASSPASCSESARRTRSSSGSTSGCSTAVISVGFPGTVASLRQQWGRAGRRDHGLAVLVASEDALDQYFMREPETLLGRRVEAAILDHENPRVLDGHVAAAAFEAPIDDADARDPRRRGAPPRCRAPGADEDRRGLRLGRPRLPGRALRPPLGEP